MKIINKAANKISFLTTPTLLSGLKKIDIQFSAHGTNISTTTLSKQRELLLNEQIMDVGLQELVKRLRQQHITQNLGNQKDYDQRKSTKRTTKSAKRYLMKVFNWRNIILGFVMLIPIVNILKFKIRLNHQKTMDHQQTKDIW